jgi:hypothetical protein
MTSITNTKTGEKIPAPRPARQRKPSTRGPVSVVRNEEPAPLTVPSTALAHAPEARLVGESIQTFANAIGAVEALAYVGQHELIMQLARIAYTRARQVARENGVGE